MNVRKVERTPSAHPYPLLIRHLLRTPLIYSPGREIVYRDDVRHDYRTLDARVRRLARALERLGVKPGDTVGIMERDSHRFLEAFLAVPVMGAVLHTVNVRRASEDLVKTIGHAGETVILAHVDFFDLLAPVAKRLGRPFKIVALTEGEPVPESGLTVVGEYEALLSAESGDFAFPDFPEDAVAAMFHGAGTADGPRGLAFSHRQLVTHVYGAMAGLCGFGFEPSVSATDVYMPLSPMFHVNAWGLFYLFTLLGAKQVYPGNADPETILRLADREGVTFSHADPSLLRALVNHPVAREVNLSGWKIIVGGAPLSESLCRAALDLGISPFSVYGMAETGSLLTCAALKPHMTAWPEDRQVAVRCRTGLPAPMVDLEIHDAMGDPLPHDGRSVGEVVVRTPWISQGYLDDPEASERLWSDGWLHTGDIGTIDAEGYLQITDRYKGAIKSGGEWIASQSLENLLCEHEAVAEAAVTAVPDETLGEKPLALVVLKPAFRGTVDDAELLRFCRERAAAGEIADIGVPDRIAIVETIPKTSLGKVTRRRMLKGFEEDFDLKKGP